MSRAIKKSVSTSKHAFLLSNAFSPFTNNVRALNCIASKQELFSKEKIIADRSKYPLIRFKKIEFNYHEAKKP